MIPPPSYQATVSQLSPPRQHNPYGISEANTSRLISDIYDKDNEIHQLKERLFQTTENAQKENSLLRKEITFLKEKNQKEEKNVNTLKTLLLEQKEEEDAAYQSLEKQFLHSNKKLTESLAQTKKEQENLYTASQKIIRLIKDLKDAHTSQKSLETKFKDLVKEQQTLPTTYKLIKKKTIHPQPQKKTPPACQQSPKSIPQAPLKVIEEPVFPPPVQETAPIVTPPYDAQNKALIRLFQLPDKFHLPKSTIDPLFSKCNGELFLFRKELTKAYWENTISIMMNEASQGRYDKIWLNSIQRLSQCVNSYYDKNHPYITEIMTSLFENKPFLQDSPREKSLFITHPYLTYHLWNVHNPIVIGKALKKDPKWLRMQIAIGVYMGQTQAASAYDVKTLLNRSCQSSDQTCITLLATTAQQREISSLDEDKFKEIQNLVEEALKDPKYTRTIRIAGSLLYLKQQLEANSALSMILFTPPPKHLL